MLCVVIFLHAPLLRASVKSKASELWSLKFEGNSHLNSEEIADAISQTPSSHFRFLFFGSSQLYDPVAFQIDLKRIKHLYQRKGFYQAQVTNTRVESCDSSGDKVCVTVDINEGQPTLIERVNIRVESSFPKRSPEELGRIFGLKPGEIFDHDIYERQKKTLENYLRERGYPKPEIAAQAIYDSNRNRIAVDLLVRPGYEATIGDLSFEGLNLIRAQDALSRVSLVKGNRYDPKKFDEATALLTDLDVFSTLEPELKARSMNPHIVDVVFKVSEKKLKTLQAGAGVRVENSREEARVFGEWTDRNFYKHLRTFSVHFEPRYAVVPSIFRPEQSGFLGFAEVSMRHPSFLSPWQDLRTVVGIDSDLEQGYRWYGPRVGGELDRRISQKVSIGFGYNFRYLTFYDVDLNSAGQSGRTPVPLEFLQTPNYRLAYVSQRIRIDFRDDPLEPHRGTLLQLGLSEASQVLGSGFTYLRATPEVRHYTPITRRSTFAVRALFGRIIPLIGRATPITERFYGGGAHDHRGFSYHRLSPFTRIENGRTVPVGGDLEVLFSAEERMNLIQIADHWLVGAVFFDAGDVVRAPSDFDISRMNLSLGPGLRYDSPLGILRADLGIRLNRLEEFTGDRPNPDPHSRFAVHVSFGESF